jgi:hypothetical protein
MLQFLQQMRRSTRHAQVRNGALTARLTLERLEDRVVPVIPLPPTGLQAAGTSASAIALSWNASTDPTVTGYDVIERVWINGVHDPRGSGGTPGHYAYNTIASTLTTPSDTFSGLASGSFHTYLVTAVNASGQSLYSVPAPGETWVAPTFANGPNIFLLGGGAVWSGAVNATATLSTQVRLLVNGNPLTYFVVSGPSTVSINSTTGVVTYTPAASEVGTVNITFQAANALGSITQTIQFTVAAYPSLARPTIKIASTTTVYNGQVQGVSASVVGTDGITPVSGTLSAQYNGPAPPVNFGTYPVLLIFTSSDPKNGNATLVSHLTITRATPTFSNLQSQTIVQGATKTTISGYLSAPSGVYGYPAAGEYVIVTVNGVSQAAPVSTNGTFATTFDTNTLPVGSYTVAYIYTGDLDLKNAPHAYTTLKVVPAAPPVVTLNPVSATVTAGDGVTFTAAATGTPVPTVQWQVSTDGGVTWTNITGNTSAQTTSLTFITNLAENGDEFRAVFTNSAGTATTAVVTLTVESDTGGGD